MVLQSPKVLIKAALNGSRARHEHEALPLSPASLARDAAEVRAAGAGAVHVHARDRFGRETLEAEHCADTIDAVRAACPGLPLGLTTGLWIVKDAGRRLALVFAAGVLVWGVGIALVGATSSTVVVLLLLAGVGAGNTVVDVAAITLLQRSAPAKVIGRVFGVMESVLLGAIGVGSIAAPALISLVGVRPAIVITGLALPVAVALTGRWLVRLDTLPDATATHVRLLRELTLFAPLSQPALEQIAVNLRSVAVPEGTAVIREGDPGDEFYIVEQGALRVTVGGMPAAPIHAGGFFGEIALLRDVPRTATVIATADCVLLALEREQFLAAVTGHADSVAAADLVAARRLAALRPAVTPI